MFFVDLILVALNYGHFLDGVIQVHSFHLFVDYCYFVFWRVIYETACYQ
jgi:hypothetical protein